MSTRFVSAKCPECHAILDIEEGRTQCFCSYCGTKILIDKENEFIYRNIDEAKVKQVESEQLLRLREMELEERDNERKRRSKKVAYIIAAVLFISGIIVFSGKAGFTGMFLILAGVLIAEFNFLGPYYISDKKKKKRRILISDEIQISEQMCECTAQNYNIVVALYRSAGFEHVSAIPLCDLNKRTSKKNGQVAEIAINGNTDFDEGDMFQKTDNVTITYHSFT